MGILGVCVLQNENRMSCETLRKTKVCTLLWTGWWIGTIFRWMSYTFHYDKAACRSGSVNRSSLDHGILFVHLQEGMAGQQKAIAYLFGDWSSRIEYYLCTWKYSTEKFLESLCSISRMISLLIWTNSNAYSGPLYWGILEMSSYD